MRVWLNGNLVDTSDASINVYDHGLLYGDGVFEGIRSYNGRVFMLDAHVSRLFDSALAIRLEIPFSHDDLCGATYETLKANGLTDGYIRMVVTRGSGTLGINPFKCPKPRAFIIADTITMYPREMYENGMSVIVSSTVRNHPNALSPRIKSLNYLNNVIAKIEAVDAGVPEAIMLNPIGLVCEATGDNVFVYRNGKLITPSPTAGILEGITRSVVMDLARKAGIPMIEADLSRYDLYTSQECFLTGTAAEVIPVTQIDGRKIGDGKVGKVARQIMDEFHAFVRRSD
jgi:branched-chain amino acid aminotransferase